MEEITRSPSLKAFLEAVPPGSLRHIDEGVVELSAVGKPVTGEVFVSRRELKPSDVYLPCAECTGERYFRCLSGDSIIDGPKNLFLWFECRNCQKTKKVFAIHVALVSGKPRAIQVRKYGEHPSFGPSLPPRLLTMLRADAELLSKGRRAENQSMGLGAFSYYRRVVENQKKHLFEEIARVADRIGSPPEVTRRFREAALETRFSDAVERAKDGLPPVLMVENRNPLLLLHNALSDGLHGRSDEECLELAADIRNVLAALAERLTEALTDHEELKRSVQRLVERTSKKAAPPNESAP